jgi:hypothetical protein
LDERSYVFAKTFLSQSEQLADPGLRVRDIYILATVVRSGGMANAIVLRQKWSRGQIHGARSPIGGEPSAFSNPLREVDPNRIGVWGTSYAGGHVLVLGATDRRIRAVVSQVPTISGYEQGLRRVPPDAIAALERLFDEDERAQFRGQPPRRQQVVSDDPSVPASYRAKDAISFYLQPVPPGWSAQAASPGCTSRAPGSRASRPRRS